MVLIAYHGERHEDFVPLRICKTVTEALDWLSKNEGENVILDSSEYDREQRYGFTKRYVMRESDKENIEPILLLQKD